MLITDSIRDRTGLTFYASAYYQFDEAGNKHSPVFLADKTPLNTQKSYNVSKTYLGERSTSDNNIVVIDIDGTPPEEMVKYIPELASTLTTTTTKDNHKHYYLIVPDDFPNTRVIGCQLPTAIVDEQKFDILSSGIVGEGYPMSIVDNDTTLKQASEETIKKLRAYIPQHLSVNKGTYYKNKSYARIVEEAVEEMPIDKKGLKALIKATIPKQLFDEQYKSSKGKLKFPMISYQIFNDLVTKLSYNYALHHEIRDKYIEKLITEIYGFKINSAKTQQMLKQIVPSLPRNEPILDDEDSFAKHLDFTRIGNFYMIKYVVEKQMNYAQLHSKTMKLRQIAKHNDFSMTQATILAEFPLSKEDLDMIPLVKLMDNPFKPYITYDEEHEITTLNITHKTAYEEKAIPNATKPDNPLTKLVYSVLGEHLSYSKHGAQPINSEELYYHWLSWLLFHPTDEIGLVPVMATHSGIDGGTGKSHLLGTIPDRLCGSVKTANETDIDHGWADLVIGTKGILFNDLKDKKYWNAVVGFIKDYGSTSLRRVANLKKGSMMVLDIPKLMSSISCNFLPSIDQSDRRLWFLRPQHLEGKTERMEALDVSLLDSMLGTTDTPHQDFQDLANYLLYLYNTSKDKFRVEMTAYAPHTEYRDAALLEDKNYSLRLLPALAQGPEALDALLSTTERREYYYKFIVWQYVDIAAGYITLPYQFIDTLLGDVSDGHMTGLHVKKASIAAALGIEVSSISNHTSTGKGKNFKKEFPESEHYTEGGQIRINMLDVVIEKYKKELK